MCKMKTLLSLFLTALLVCSSFNGINVFADQSKTVGVTASVDKTTVKAGESFVETVSMNNFVNVVGGVQAFKMVIDFDGSKFSGAVSPYKKNNS